MGKILASTEHQSRSTSGIQALREAEREYHQSQVALGGLRDEQRRRTTSIRSHQGQGFVRRRITDIYKDQHKSTNKGIR